MPEALTLTVAGRPLRVPAGVSVLAAVQAAGVSVVRRSLGGGPRGALCGMGACFECRAWVDGALLRTCLTPARSGMTVTFLNGEGLGGEDGR